MTTLHGIAPLALHAAFPGRGCLVPATRPRPEELKSPDQKKLLTVWVGSGLRVKLLRAIQKQQKRPQQPSVFTMADSNGYGWLTTKQVAGISGLSTAHLHSLRKKGLSPPYHQMGRKVLYRRADIDTWLQTTRHDPQLSA
jgi:predicted DNA-binding transcriptional regulator AlpA